MTTGLIVSAQFESDIATGTPPLIVASTTVVPNLHAAVADSVTGALTSVFNEVPGGAINGTTGSDGNAVFTLAVAPSPASSLQVWRIDNGSGEGGYGARLFDGIHFNLAGLTITFTAGNIPVTGVLLRASYTHA